jgi:hypothetical protein
VESLHDEEETGGVESDMDGDREPEPPGGRCAYAEHDCESEKARILDRSEMDEGEQTCGDGDRDRVTQTRGEGSLYEAPVDEFLDDRCADRDDEDKQYRGGSARPTRQVRSILPELIIAECVRPDGLEGQIHGRDEDDLAEHADPDSEDVSTPDPQPVVGGEPSGAEPTTHVHHRNEVADPHDHHRRQHESDRCLAGLVVSAGGKNGGTQQLTCEPGDRPSGQRHEWSDQSIAWTQERRVVRPEGCDVHNATTDVEGWSVRTSHRLRDTGQKFRCALNVQNSTDDQCHVENIGLRGP